MAGSLKRATWARFFEALKQTGKVYGPGGALEAVGRSASTYEYWREDPEFIQMYNVVRSHITPGKASKQEKLDFVGFRDSILGRHTFPHMIQWAEWFEDDTNDHILILCPPETAKTTIVLDKILHMIYLDPNVRIGYASRSLPHSIKQVSKVKNVIEQNVLLNEITDGLVPGPDDPHPWRDTYFTVRTRQWIAGSDEADYTLAAFGAGSQITGSRFDLIVFDDPDDVNVGQADREKVWNVILQAGEPLALDTPVPTPSGWSTMGELLPGDKVFASDGTQANVVAVHPVHYGRKTYRVVFTDGTSIVSDSGHLWTVVDRGLGGSPMVSRTTEEMFLLDRRNRYSTHRRFFVPFTPVLGTKPADLPVDPYVLGAWLGDGESKSGAIFGLEDDLREIVGEINSRGYETRPRKPARCPAVGVLGLQAQLRSLRVLNDKHIPGGYLRASATQRLDLLRGLMDTDGTAGERSQCEFSSKWEHLARQVVELLRTLGYKPTLIRKREPRSHTGYTWRVYFRGNPARNPFLMLRKSEKVKGIPKIKNRGIVRIEPVPSVPVRCITVDTVDHLFLAGPGMIQTHNTRLGTGGRMIVIGNRQDEEDVYRRILDQWEDDPELWNIYTQAAVQEWVGGGDNAYPSKVIWPEKFGLGRHPGREKVTPNGPWDMERACKFFDLKRRRLRRRFFLVYQNDPQGNMERDFPKELVERARSREEKIGEVPAGSLVICSLDPAPVGGAAILVYALLPPDEKGNRKRKIVDFEWGENWRHAGTIDRIKFYGSKYRPRFWVIERSATSRYLLDDPTVLGIIQAQGATLHEVSTGTNKHDRDYGVASVRNLFFVPDILIPSRTQNDWEYTEVLRNQWNDYVPGTTRPHDGPMTAWFAERCIADLRLDRRAFSEGGGKMGAWQNPYGGNWRGGGWSFGPSATIPGR